MSALFVEEHVRDGRRVAIPRPEIHVVARFGSAAQGGLDVSALGVRQKAHRKFIQGGQRIVMARLRLGAQLAVLGVPASAITGRIVSLSDLWGEAAERRLRDRLAAASGTHAAAAVLEEAIAERLLSSEGPARTDRAQLALDSTALLTRANVRSVAHALGVSERHLRRVFHETIGVSPKMFARLVRFERALRAARAGGQTSWAGIAADSGYYDQAHLIAEFRELSGVTPQSLLEELRAQAIVS